MSQAAPGQSQVRWICGCGHIVNDNEYQAIGKYGCPNCNGEKQFRPQTQQQPEGNNVKIYYFNMAGKVKAYTHKRRADRAVNRAYFLGESGAKLQTIELQINRESILAAFVAGARAIAGDAAITLDGAGE